MQQYHFEAFPSFVFGYMLYYSQIRKFKGFPYSDHGLGSLRFPGKEETGFNSVFYFSRPNYYKL